jgi:hypothetical protein
VDGPQHPLQLVHQAREPVGRSGLVLHHGHDRLVLVGQLAEEFARASEVWDVDVHHAGRSFLLGGRLPEKPQHRAPQLPVGPVVGVGQVL